MSNERDGGRRTELVAPRYSALAPAAVSTVVYLKGMRKRCRGAQPRRHSSSEAP